MKTAVIVDSVRTGLAKSHRGGFNMTRPDDMLAHIINNMLDRNPSLPPEMVEDVIMGCGNPEGAMGHNIGRNAAVLSNLPLSVGGTTVNRYCSSGLQSISMAASQVMAGCYDTVIAGGGEQITMLSGKQNMDGFVNEPNVSLIDITCPEKLKMKLHLRAKKEQQLLKRQENLLMRLFRWTQK